VYLTVGAVCAWRTGFGGGLLGASVVGLLAGTVGPLIAWLIGSGPVDQDITEPRIFAYRIAVVTATAAAVGLVGAAAASWLERRRGVRGSGVVPR
jgi:CDP-diglyceride synthetase